MRERPTIRVGLSVLENDLHISSLIIADELNNYVHACDLICTHVISSVHM